MRKWQPEGGFTGLGTSPCRTTRLRRDSTAGSGTGTGTGTGTPAWNTGKATAKPATLTCPVCQTENEADREFCKKCANPLRAIEVVKPRLVTRDGDEAKAMLKRRELPALVIANLSLPRLDGFALTVIEMRGRRVTKVRASRLEHAPGAAGAEPAGPAL